MFASHYLEAKSQNSFNNAVGTRIAFFNAENGTLGDRLADSTIPPRSIHDLALLLATPHLLEACHKCRARSAAKQPRELPSLDKIRKTIMALEIGCSLFSVDSFI